MNTSFAQPAASQAAATWLAQAAVPETPLSATELQQLQPLGEQLFATDGAQALARLDPLAAAREWLASAPPGQQALVGLVGSGLQMRLRCYIAGPDLALFIQRIWSPADDDRNGGATVAGVAAAFRLAARLRAQAASIRQAGRWPEGRRLVVIDDAFDQQRWGWLAAGGGAAAGAALATDPTSYLSAFVSLQQLP